MHHLNPSSSRKTCSRPKVSESRAWAFCADPNRYRILDAIRSLDVEPWATTKSHVKAGDRAIIWQTQDKLGRRGIVGLCQILSDPENRDDRSPFWLDPEEGRAVLPRVVARYVHAPNLPLWVGQSGDDDFLRSLKVARARGGTVFHVSSHEWDRILELAGGWAPPSDEESEAIDRLTSRSGERRRQGFGLNPDERRAVEQHAMAAAKSHFQRLWDKVEDVSLQASYDLLCLRGEEELHVEVKGTTGKGERIILTKNEVQEATTSAYAIFLLSQIQLSHEDGGEPRAKGGVPAVFDPWRADSHALTPLAFSCELDWSKATYPGSA